MKPDRSCAIKTGHFNVLTTDRFEPDWTTVAIAAFSFAHALLLSLRQG